jgi:hypothetical protein
VQSFWFARGWYSLLTQRKFFRWQRHQLGSTQLYRKCARPYSSPRLGLRGERCDWTCGVRPLVEEPALPHMTTLTLWHHYFRSLTHLHWVKTKDNASAYDYLTTTYQIERRGVLMCLLSWWGLYPAPTTPVLAVRDDPDYEWFSPFHSCELCTGCPSTSSDPPLDAAPVSAAGIFVMPSLAAETKQAAMPSHPL